MILTFKYVLFLSALVALIVLGLDSGASIPGVFQFWDKAQHSIAYTFLCVMGCFTFPHHIKRIIIGLIVHGAALEVMQSSFTTTRVGDILDLLSDCIGVLAGLLFYFAAKRIFRNRINHD